MDLTHPFFSVIIPSYNQSNYLPQALNSILEQTDVDWEAIVIDDGSTDDTEKVAQEYVLKDSRVRFFYKDNGGTGSALNEGIRQARGEWICWLSTDDLFAPKKLELQRHHIESFPDCKFFFTYVSILWEKSGKMMPFDLFGPIPKREYLLMGMFYRNYISGISISVHRDAWKNVGLFNETLRYGQDYDIWLRLLAIYPARLIPEYTCISRAHTAQGSVIFPEACWFDASNAGIKFLNQHNYSELFPLLDLKNTSVSINAILSMLKVAVDPSSYIYSLGPHLGLFLRLFEWLNCLEENEYNNSIDIIRLTVTESLRKIHTFEISFLLKTILVAIALPKIPFSYIPVSPQVTAERFIHSRSCHRKTNQDALSRYLEEFEGIHIEKQMIEKLDCEVLLNIPLAISFESFVENQDFAKVLRIAHSLNEKGLRVVLLGNSKTRLGSIDGFIFIGVCNETERASALDYWERYSIDVTSKKIGSPISLIYSIPHSNTWIDDEIILDIQKLTFAKQKQSRSFSMYLSRIIESSNGLFKKGKRVIRRTLAR